MAIHQSGPGPSIETVINALRAEVAEPGASAARREFTQTYLGTTQAVAKAIRAHGFEDPEWVEAWDVAFAQLFLDAVRAERTGGLVPRPWRVAFDAPAGTPPVVQVLLGVNAHINYDLPQALIAVIDDDQFADPTLLDRRRRDHERIDAILASRVAAEDVRISAHSARTLLDRALRPANRAASKRFLREARMKVWHNTLELQRARLSGPGAYAGRLAELEVISAARVNDLLAPGQVLLRLAVAGFGVTLRHRPDSVGRAAADAPPLGLLEVGRPGGLTRSRRRRTDPIAAAGQDHAGARHGWRAPACVQSRAAR